MRKWFPLFVCTIYLLASCKPSKPPGVLSEAKMAKVLVDYHLAQGMAEGTTDSEKNRYIYIQKVFKKHHISETDFDSSMVYYSIHAEDMAKIYKIVYERIEANANLMGVETEKTNKYANMSEDGDTANIWSGEKVFTIKARPMENIAMFRIKADSTFRKGDSFLWHFKTNFLVQDNTRELYAILTVQYRNDSVASSHKMIRLDEETNLDVHPDSNQDTLSVKSVYGCFYMPPPKEEAEAFRMAQASELALVRYHKANSIPDETPVIEEDEDTLDMDGMADTVPTRHERLSPMEMRESQPRQKTIQVIKEKAINKKLRIKRNVNGSIHRRN